MGILEESEPFNILQKENQKLYEKLNVLFGENCINKLQKQVALYNMDESFANYLSDVAIIQNGMKLKIMGGKNPLREFQTETNQCFDTLQSDIQENILIDFASMELSESGLLNLQGRREPPTLTWTYLVKDNTVMDSLILMMTGSLGGGNLNGGGFARVSFVHVMESVEKISRFIKKKFM